MALVSVLVAFYNEEANLPALRERLEQLAFRLDGEYAFEFVLIDDHSDDQGPGFVRLWSTIDPRVRYLRLARNSGSHAAYAAGLAEAKGDCAVLLAADLQDPPETIPLLLEQWKAGHDVVWATRAARENISWTTRFTASIYYALMRRWALPNMPEQGADFALFDRRVINACVAIAEKHTSLLGTVLWLGFRQTEIPYVKQARAAGRSKWTFAKKVKMFVDSVLSFSTLPVRLLWLLTALFGLMFAASATVLVGCLALGHSVPGWAWAALAGLLAVTLQQASLALVAEYVWRAYDQVRGRPRFVLEENTGGHSPSLRKAA